MTKYSHLNTKQRYQIEALLKTGMNQTAISKQLGVHKSTICRELKKNSKRYLKADIYDPEFAHHLTCKRKMLRSRYQKIDEQIVRRIIWLLRHGWSPEQISQVCKQRMIPMLSTEAIYLWIYDQKRKGMDYTHWLRRHHRKRRKRCLNKQPRNIIKNRVSIDKRPEIVAGQKRIGDLEADLMKCTNGYLLTITERKSLVNFITKIPDKSTQTVRKAMISKLRPFKDQIQTITTDNGLEFASHQDIAIELGINWYFADPYCSWQRGCNENQNGLIRQYASRKTDLNKITDQQIKYWETKLNNRPRKKLNFNKPIHIFNQHSNVALVT